MPTNPDSNFEELRDKFVAQWGALGTQWGINRTMAMIHSLLLVSHEPLSTNAIMENLSISRGNANTNLRDLVSWGLIHTILRKGERMEFFEAEKDVWKIFCTLARERKRRETEPAHTVLKDCVDDSKKFKSEEGQEFHLRVSELSEFVAMANGLMDRIASSKSTITPKILKLLS